LTKYPAVKILIGTLAGFVICKLLDIESGLLFPLTIVLSGIFFSLLILKYFRIALFIGSFAIGMLLFIRSESFEVKKPSKIIQPFSAVIKGEIIDILRSNENSIRCIVNGELINSVTKKMEKQSTLLTIYKSKYKSPNLLAGTYIYSDCKIRPPRPDILPDEFSEIQYTKANDIQWIATASAANLSIIEKPKPYKYFVSDIRKNISEHIGMLFPKKTVGIAICLLTGDKSQIPYEVQQSFSFAGTAHVLAVSGLHVGLISVILYLLLSFIGNSWIKFTVFSILVISFVLLTGSHASSIRAGFMAIGIMLAYALQRKSESINIVALVVLIVLIISPNMIYSVGFQMSVSAISGIIFFYPPIRKSFKSIFGEKYNSHFNFLFSSLALTFAASITVAPIIAYYFNVFSIVSPITNLLCIPLILTGMIFTIISLIMSYIYTPIAELYSATADLSYGLCMDINYFAVNLPNSYISGEMSFTLSVIISLVILYFFINNNRKLLLFRLTTSTFIIILAMFVFIPEDKEEIEIYPRENLVATFVPTHDKLFVMITDRKPSQYPSVDYSLLRYIESKDKELILGITGNAGIALTDVLKKSRRFQIIEIPIEQQKEIAKVLNIKKEFPQIIEY